MTEGLMTTTPIPDFEELAGLEAAATPGPWRLLDQKLRPQFSAKILEIQAISGKPVVVAWGGFDSADGTRAKKRANARLLVKLRNALPFLLSERETLAREKAELVEKVRGLVETVRAWHRIALNDIAHACETELAGSASVSANWHGGRANGLASALEAARALSPEPIGAGNG